jgi:HSP20 family molecular chaperone IbpA/protein-disulfide isomerase
MTTVASTLLTVPVTDRDHIQGPARAVITLVEYGDYACPFCNEARSVVRRLQAELRDQLRHAFRNFPMPASSSRPHRAAEAAEAAGAQNKFWEMHALLYDRQLALSDKHLKAYATQVGLDMERFNRDMLLQTFGLRVREDALGAIQSGVKTTPTFFINGSPYLGPYTFETMLSRMEEVIHKRSTSDRNTALPGSLRGHLTSTLPPVADSTIAQVNNNDREKEFSMASETEQSKATSPTHEEEDRSSPGGGMIRKSQEGGLATRRRSVLAGFPFTPQEMLSMNPFSLLGRMTQEFDRILQPFLSEGEAANIAWVPRVEIAQKDGEYQILAELPGLSPNEVRVEVDDEAIILQGERQIQREANEGGVRRSERQFGMFYRRIPLPEGADTAKASAKFRDGILEITMPAPTRPTERRQIQVEADSKAPSDTAQHAA